MLCKVALLATLCFALSGATSPPLPKAPPVCDLELPLWNMKLGDNAPLEMSPPKFRLIVKGSGPANTYKSRGSHHVMLKVNKPKKKGAKLIHGFTLHFTNDNADCRIGRITLKRGSRVPPITVRKGCDFVYLDGTESLNKVVGIKWKPPKCGCVTLSISVKSDDNLLFYDSDDPEIAAENKYLTKRLCAPVPVAATTEA